MKCQTSKFLIISILTFLIGVVIVQVWQGNDFQENSETQNQNTQPNLTRINNQPIQIDFCEEIKKDPKYPNVTPIQGLLTVSGGVLNQRVCNPLPYREIDIKTRDWTKEYIMVQVTIDENGFVMNSSVTTKNKFGKRFEKIAKRLRVRPIVISGRNFKCAGVLIFYPNENYSKR